MAATYDQLAQTATDGIFQRRVAYAMMSAAIAIYNETPTAKTPARVAFAKQVIAGGYNITAITEMVLTDATIAGELTMVGTPGANVADAHIQNSVNANWNAWAGA
jgi:hypothetical protein